MSVYSVSATLSLVFSGYPWFPVVIVGYQVGLGWLSLVSSGYHGFQWRNLACNLVHPMEFGIPVDTISFQWLSLVSPWFSVVIPGRYQLQLVMTGLFYVFNGYRWLYRWFSMLIVGQWLSCTMVAGILGIRRYAGPSGYRWLYRCQFPLVDTAGIPKTSWLVIYIPWLLG